MKLTIDLNLLHQLSPDEILFFEIIKKNNKVAFRHILDTKEALILTLEKLKQKEFITFESLNIDMTLDDITILHKDIKDDFVMSKVTVSQWKKEVVHWIKEYRDIFPKGMNNNGYPYKGDKQGCIANMAKFLYNYPEFSDKNLILEATRTYVQEKAKDNYNYMQMASRFIWKNGGSSLAAYCEQLKDGEIKNEKSNVINL